MKRVVLIPLAILFAVGVSPLAANPLFLQQEQENSDQASTDVTQQPVPGYENPLRGEVRDIEPRLDLLNMFMSLLIVVGLILIMAYLARKYLPNTFRPMGAGKDVLQLVQMLPLGNRRFACLISADGKRLLLGVTDHQVTLLKSLDEPAFEDALADAGEARTVAELLEEESDP